LSAPINDHKKPGVAFWATVGSVVVRVYVLGVGAARWLVMNESVPALLGEFMAWIYWPLEKLRKNGPTPVREALRWYYGLWSPWADTWK
jgi:hypothetical protein